MEDVWIERTGRPDFLGEIPWNLRPTWLLLQSEIRTFGEFGVLAPFYSELIKLNEHYRNLSRNNIRKVTYPIILKLLETSPYLLRSLFPNVNKSVTIREMPYMDIDSPTSRRF